MAKLQTVVRDQLDERCDQFEAEWKAGRRPSLRTFLAEWAEPAAEQLFRHLLELDVDYRKRAGEPVAATDYEAEFPQYLATIKEVVWQPGLAETRALGTGNTKPTGSVSAPPPTTIVGYELLEVLGQGGMGVVYKARQTRLNRLVAVKMLLSGGLASAEEVQRFHVEAEAAAKLDHPNIVPIYEVGEYGGRHFFSMAYIEGPSLSQRLRDEQLPIRAAAHMVQTIAEAIHYAHQQGIIHRDLKPANILLGQDGRPRISDFGLAKSIESAAELTTTGQILGTPSYMAPEQAAGRIQEISPRTDVYALGTILYEMLVGRAPFRDPSVWETIQQVIHTEPVSPRLLNRSVPRDLETIVLKSLDKQPGSRFATAQDFADDLGRFLRDEPILARPVGRLEKSLRWAKKNRTVAALVSTLFVLTMAIAAGSAIGAKVFQAREQDRTKLVGEKAELVTKSNQLQQETKTLQKQGRAQRYQADMILAGDSWRIPSGIGRVRDLVDPWAKDTEQPDLRGWEWHLLRSAAHEEWNFIEIKTREGISVPLSTIAFHPRDEIVAFGSPTGELFVGPIEGGQIESGGEHASHIRSVAWEPGGARLATSSNDGKIVLWDLNPLRKADEIVCGKIVYAVAFSPHGKYLAAGVDRDGIHVFDPRTKARVAHLNQQVDSQPALAFSPRSDLLAVSAHLGGDSYEIHLWNIETWRNESLENDHPLRGHKQQINRISWSRSGRQLVSASFDRTVKLWDVPSAQLVHSFDDHAAQVTAAQFLRNDRELVSVGWDYSFRRFDIATRQQTYFGRGHTKRAEWCDLNPQGDLLATVGEDGFVRLWDLKHPDPTIVERKHPARSLEDPFPQLVWKHDGKQLAASNNSQTSIWRVEQVEPHVNEVGALPQWSAGDEYFCVWRGDTLEVRDLRGQEPMRTFKSPEQGFGIWHSAWSNRGATLLVHVGSRLFRWDVAGGKPQQLVGGLNDVRAVAWSPDDQRVLSTGTDGLVRVFSTADGQELSSFKPHQLSYAISVAWSPNGTQYITCSPDRTAGVWDAATNAKVLTLAEHSFTVHHAQWSPDGKRIATAGGDSTVRIWDAATGEQTLILRHPDQVLRVAWSPNGRQLASLSQDGTILVHDATRSYENDEDQ